MDNQQSNSGQKSKNQGSIKNFMKPSGGLKMTHHELVQGFITKSEKLRKEKRGQIIRRKRMVRVMQNNGQNGGDAESERQEGEFSD